MKGIKILVFVTCLSLAFMGCGPSLRGTFVGKQAVSGSVVMQNTLGPVELKLKGDHEFEFRRIGDNSSGSYEVTDSKVILEVHKSVTMAADTKIELVRNKDGSLGLSDKWSYGQTIRLEPKN